MGAQQAAFGVFYFLKVSAFEVFLEFGEDSQGERAEEFGLVWVLLRAAERDVLHQFVLDCCGLVLELVFV